MTAQIPLSTRAVASFRATFPRGAAVVVIGAVLAACSSDGGRVREDGAPLGTDVEANEPADLQGNEAEPPAAGTGNALIVADGWVDGSTNGLEIQGSFFTYGDGSGRTLISEAPGASATGSGYCVSGTSAQVVDGDFGGTWGAVAAFNLSQQPGDDTARGYNADDHGVVGFGFEIVGNTGGALRFVVKQLAVHDGFCINNVPDCEMGCSVQYLVSDLQQNCWTPGGVAPNSRSLQALEWQITTREAGAIEFDYCVENIQAVMGQPEIQ
jgi:hypothetical protein